ncbi:hypothetical protein DIS24_g10559 [Lasiodiplodia hormozganensis]|uniref:GXWXG domain-containing protein n=1 Tax=Lasiodiplodia hormozganensis TaxID=869390 RepID=A0AA39XP90_9PEZI|nr:Transcription factor cmr1 protein [Lasiodiplodia theobromae]KAF4536474.1 Transcription factor cmr1 protein [Lasiodiplodia theobromae]KAK0637693.1 hypothetical protein DIS24_g10559 [Lasiodiplodia hormozganensis]
MSSVAEQTPRPIGAEDRALHLISAAANGSTAPVQLSELYELADTLPPLKPVELLGEWSSGGLDTEHPTYCWLKSINWIGVTFRSADDVNPLVVAVQTRDGSGTRRKWLDEWGNGEVSLFLSPDGPALPCDLAP